MSHPVLIAMIALIMFTLRVAGLFADRIRVHPDLERALRFAPVAVLSALAATTLANQGSGDPIRFLAAIGGGVLMLLTRRMWICIVGGFSLYWMLRVILGTG